MKIIVRVYFKRDLVPRRRKHESSQREYLFGSKKKATGMVAFFSS
jgi:hypothetical protein